MMVRLLLKFDFVKMHVAIVTSWTQWRGVTAAGP